MTTTNLTEQDREYITHELDKGLRATPAQRLETLEDLRDLQRLAMTHTPNERYLDTEEPTYSSN